MYKTKMPLRSVQLPDYAKVAELVCMHGEVLLPAEINHTTAAANLKRKFKLGVFPLREKSKIIGWLVKPLT